MQNQDLSFQEFSEIAERTFWEHALSSIILLLTISVLWIIVTLILRRGNHLEPQQRRRWKATARAIITFTLILGLLYTWAPELRTFALSIVAFAVAIVIATKELIMCFLGGLLRLGSGALKIGDWVSIGSHRGEVVDLTMLSTTLEQLGASDRQDIYSGRKIVIPNSLFLTTPVINESSFGSLILHEMTFPISAEKNWRIVKDRLMKSVKQKTELYVEETKENLKFLSDRKRDHDNPLDPSLIVRTPNPENIEIIIQCYVPRRYRYSFENSVREDFLDEIQKSTDKNDNDNLGSTTSSNI